MTDQAENAPAKRRSEGTLQRKREQLSWDQQEFRILSIDGGGIKGILPASILAECERKFTGGRTAGDYFDMVAGTSTGGIIALGFGVGMTAASILDIYIENGASIFPKRNISSWKAIASAQTLKHLITDASFYRYERTALAVALRKVFGLKTIGDAERRLVIPTFDQYTEVNLIKTPHHPDFKMDWRDSLVDVALATSAAPTYFSTFKKGDRHFADGGVWANNPVMNALIDALTCYDIQNRQVRIISIGCGDQGIEFTEGQKKRGGLFHWREIISSAMHLQSQNATGQAGLLIGRDQLLRLNTFASPHPIAMDDYQRALLELPTKARLLVDTNEDTLASFFDAPRAAFTAYHGARVKADASPKAL